MRKSIKEEFAAQVLQGGDFRDFDNIHKYITEDTVDHFQPPGFDRGLEGVRQRFEAWGAAFTYLRADRPVLISQGDYFLQVQVIYFKHTGTWLGLTATNRVVQVGGVDVFRMENGKVAERWGLYDLPNLADQLGAVVTVEKKEEAAPEDAAAKRPLG